MEVQQKTCALTQFGSYVQVKKFPVFLLPQRVLLSCYPFQCIMPFILQLIPAACWPLSIRQHREDGHPSRFLRFHPTEKGKETSKKLFTMRWRTVTVTSSGSNPSVANFFSSAKKNTMHKDLRDVVCVQWQSTVPRFISVHPWMFSSRPLGFKFVDANVKSAEPAPATCALCCPAKNEHSEP